ncbi:flavin reductase family protein [Niveibacterium microcysteis]|uniref:Flavin reductase family protein n=1 Tax=Niveibacterium microcysteis TaxID=2811415 RepID=A0ABX7M910_9RHOO|nr:flavin reductase family protein [Niveibacterium microcysteis]QSI75977.1 flavin reductase family protein [Niveibacterium microcysteis]
MIIPVDLAKAYRMLNHGPVTLVSSAHGDQRNVMAAAWAMPLDFSPPKVAVVIDKQTFTRGLVEASGEFVLNIPARGIAAQVIAAGGHSGRDGDKFDALGLATLPSAVVAAPRVAGCVGWLECRVIREPHNEQAYDLFLGEVVAASADARVFRDGHWLFDEATDPNLRTLHYVAGGQFYATGDSLQVASD